MKSKKKEELVLIEQVRDNFRLFLYIMLVILAVFIGLYVYTIFSANIMLEYISYIGIAICLLLILYLAYKLDLF